MSQSITELKRTQVGGVIRQRQDGFVLLRLKATLGDLSSEQLSALAEAARRFGRGKIHITTRQGVEIPWVRSEDVDELVAHLAASGIGLGATGPRVRVISACQGEEVCPHAVGSTRSLGLGLDGRFYGLEGPAKFKIAVTGCPNSCAKPQENDLGFVAVAQPEVADEALCVSCEACSRACKAGALELTGAGPRIDPERCVRCGACARACPTGALVLAHSGWDVYLGGRVGRHPALGRIFRRALTEGEALDLAGAVLRVWRHLGRPKERLGSLIERIGPGAFEAELAAASSRRNGYSA